ncbi:MAG: hypothetical protein BWZ01_01190 [Deltaproteobacteria bacterium ADurb.BinA179]|jgi:hypothetical protein|nr:hypothetical protein [Deltaproteobacteria bacterium]MDI9542582.1 hypothetical protein [Pseudomonadota bacterium]NLW66883.1 hypothetical protein [Bacteriovoracaceae bacterium]OPZ28355.1 MAG: hypothetical protein BWZ01_01190 [Deltaproteobacteria bacterium ADurb.BinA179]HRR21288.1 hypothetical protein [Desulfomonilia bacterium]
MSQSADDEKTTRCPMLGHLVPFSYCRQCGDSLPCRKIMDCWSGRIDVQGFLDSTYTKEEISRIVSPPKAKLLQIVELARAARSRNYQ